MLEMLKAPPANTISPPLKSPPDQLTKLLAAIVSDPWMVPPDSSSTVPAEARRDPLMVLAVTLVEPCRVLLPSQSPKLNEPLSVSRVPVVVNAQPMVNAPFPATFWRVPVLINLLVPDWLLT